MKVYLNTKAGRGLMALGAIIFALTLVIAPLQKVNAAPIFTMAYAPTGAVVGTFVAASATVSTFTPVTAITAASTITLTLPAGTTLTPANIVAGDFTIQQASNGGGSCVAGAATAPSTIAADNTARTLVLTVDAASLSNTCASGSDDGLGVVTVSTSGTAGGNEIQHSTTVTTSGAFTVATSVGDTGAIATVTFVVGAATAVFVETAANGSGAVYGPASVYVSGSPVTVYSITRDTYSNFVSNVAATAWSLTNKTGDLVNGDLVAAGDSRSAVFTGNSIGTATIHVTSGALTAGDSGSVSVVRSSGGGSRSSETPVVVPASINISVPVSGASFTAGKQIGFAWAGSNGAFVSYRVSYSYDNGSTWTVVADKLPNTSYTWMVPTESTTQGKIKVEGLDSSGAVIASAESALFTVVGTTPAPVTPVVVPPVVVTPAPAVDPTIKGSYNAAQAKANNPSINDDKALPVAANPACTAGDLIKGTSLPAIYYCGTDGKRYVFVNDRAFFSWYSDFSGVKVLSDEDLAKITIGGNVTYRPGTRMIKIVSDPKVYVIARGGTLRWVASEDVAKQLFGADWNKMIDDVADSFFVNYKIGDPATL